MPGWLGYATFAAEAVGGVPTQLREVLLMLLSTKAEGDGLTGATKARPIGLLHTWARSCAQVTRPVVAEWEAKMLRGDCGLLGGSKGCSAIMAVRQRLAQQASARRRRWGSAHRRILGRPQSFSNMSPVPNWRCGPECQASPHVRP